MTNLSNLSPQIIIALITSTFALIIAITQIIFRFYDSRKIENLKAMLESKRETNLEYLKHYIEFTFEGKENEIKAFKNFLFDIQSLRDMYKSIKNNPTGYSPKLLINELSEIAHKIVNTFAQNQLYFNSGDFDIAHNLKNKSKDFINELIIFLENIKEGDSIIFSDDINFKFQEISELQKELRGLAAKAIDTFIMSMSNKIKN